MAASKIKHQYDALLALRSLTDRATPVVADGAGGGYVNLHHLTSGGAYTGTPGIPGALGDLVGQFGQTPFDVVILVDSIDTTSGTETYILKLQTVDSAHANPTDVPAASLTVTGALVGEPIVLKVDPSLMKLADPDCAYLRIFADVGGATPSIVYFAFAAPNSES